MREVAGVALVARFDFEDHAVLVALGIDRGDLALRVGIGQHIGDVLHAYAQPRSRLPVDADAGLQTTLFTIGADIGNAGHLLDALDHLRQPGIKLANVRTPQRKLVIGVAVACAGADVARRRQVDA